MPCATAACKEEITNGLAPMLRKRSCFMFSPPIRERRRNGKRKKKVYEFNIPDDDHEYVDTDLQMLLFSYWLVFFVLFYFFIIFFFHAMKKSLVYRQPNLPPPYTASSHLIPTLPTFSAERRATPAAVERRCFSSLFFLVCKSYVDNIYI